MSYAFNLLTADEQKQVEDLWHDGLDPNDFIYELNKTGQVVRRQMVGDINNSFPGQLPQPVSSCKKNFKPTKIRNIFMIG